MDLQLAHVVIGAVSAAVGAAGGLVAGVWRVAHIEQDLREDFQEAITKLTSEFVDKMASQTTQFDETFKGLRQKINDVELDTVKNFVAKGDFDDFRLEYREDMRDLKNSIAGISRAH